MLIVDMPMPKNCCECDLRQDDFDRGEQYCPFTGVECLSIGRQAKCPIKGELVRCGECRYKFHNQCNNPIGKFGIVTDDMYCDCCERKDGKENGN